MYVSHVTFLTVVIFYLVTFPIITTVAHVLGVLLGIIEYLVSKRCGIFKVPSPDDDDSEKGTTRKANFLLTNNANGEQNL